MAIDINIPIENAVTDGSLNPVTSNAVFDALAYKANTADLATVATTGDYNDLSNLPAIPSAQVNADWNATSGVAEILNKPTIPSVTGLVPYTGAVADVNLGTHKLTAKDLVVNHPSGSGDAATITKGGSGEALKVVKSSGSGNAASITGGVTLLTELDLETPLADAEISSSATWNAKIGGAVSIGQVAFGTASGVIGGDAGLFWDNVNKRLGVGATPATNVRLDVRAQGTLSTDIAFRVRNSADTLDIIRVTGNGSVFIGQGAGNVNTGVDNTANGFDALFFNTTGSNNTANGVNALRNNTTGGNDTANGVNALRNNTTGGSNTANGLNSLFFNTTGSNNTANGVQALFFNTTGGSNTANGVNALRNNTTGGNNTANGVDAGRYIADGVTSNAITNNSLFIGANTRALADNQSNQIVIGFDAIGAGSNTVTLGNTSIVKTILRGTLNAANLPTSPVGLVAGDIWNNLGILTIV